MFLWHIFVRIGDVFGIVSRTACTSDEHLDGSFGSEVGAQHVFEPFGCVQVHVEGGLRTHPFCVGIEVVQRRRSHGGCVVVVVVVMFKMMMATTRCDWEGGHRADAPQQMHPGSWGEQGEGPTLPRSPATPRSQTHPGVEGWGEKGREGEV